MKIAILTYYEIANYGTLLQAYGLWKFLEARGHQVEFLDEPYGRSMFAYKKPTLRNFISRHPIRAWRGILSRYFYNKMTEFNVNYPRTRHFESLEDLVANFKGYDAVVVGSDLVWHPKWCSPKFTEIAFLGFVPKGCKKVSVSPSFSATEWNAPGRELAGRLLGAFDGIGVREESGKKIAAEISGRNDVETFVDSALLLPFEQYEKFLSPQQEKTPYIFNYVLGWSNGEEEQAFLEIVKNKFGVSSVKGQFETGTGFWGTLSRLAHVPRRILVGEWLRRIHDASFVLTNSFHGTVFSILMHKPFATILIKGEMSGLNERAISLLKLLGLESRMMYNDESDRLRAAVDEEIDWESVDSRLDNERNRVSERLENLDL